MELGSEQYGCAHYTKRCRIRAPCCGEVFGCRHCHNEAKNSLEIDLNDRHEIPRHEIKKVICSLCDKEQDVQQYCSGCGACMGKYFCGKCNFFDDDNWRRRQVLPLRQMRNVLKESHHCVEGAMHHNCPVCFEYLFDSTKDISVLHCGHTIHLECLNEMRAHHHFACPVCSRSACDMSDAWKKLDEEVAATPMPEFYQKKMIWILCNDCGATSNVNFHVLAQKCPGCSSYNTRETRGGGPAAARSMVLFVL
uniref:CHY-type domain-containing protein n=2 Tax=Oryza punctata TaxID=4537 RepID=A0A0E0M8B4_ORYPU